MGDSARECPTSLEDSQIFGTKERKGAVSPGTRHSEGNWERKSFGSIEGDWSLELAALWGTYKAARFRGLAGRWKCGTDTLEASQARASTSLFYKSVELLSGKSTEIQ